MAHGPTRKQIPLIPIKAHTIISNKNDDRQLIILIKQQIEMAHQLDMSLNQYMQIKDLLIPKHLAVSQHSRKKNIIKRQFLLQSASDIAQEHKIKHLKPIGEIETIMKHFDAKFQNNKYKPSFFAKNTERRKTTNNQSQHELDRKISYLINLPAIKTIKRQAQRYRDNINSQEIKDRQSRKAKIIDKFNIYMQAQLRGNSNIQRRKRLNTLN